MDINYSSNLISVKDYNAYGNGEVDDTAAIQAAINAVQTKGGGTVYFPKPPAFYLVKNELLVNQDFVRLVGESRGVVLQAGTNNQAIIHFSASYGGIENFTLDGARHTGISGISAIRMTPENETQMTLLVNQNYNRVSNINIRDCAEGLVLQAGPKVNTADSGCWYNVFDTILIRYTDRGVWLKDPSDGIGSMVNRNQFYSMRIGESVNTGVQIDAGGTNSFIGCSFEGIADRTHPNLIPTAIIIKKSFVGGGDNNSNAFIATRFESNTVDVENHNRFSEFYASDIGRGKLKGTELPCYIFGSDPSQSPLVFPGLIYPEDSLPEPPKDEKYSGHWNIFKSVKVAGCIYHTKGIIFQKGDEALWRMYEDEKGLYLESLKTGETSRLILEKDFELLSKTLREQQIAIEALQEKLPFGKA